MRRQVRATTLATIPMHSTTAPTLARSIATREISAPRMVLMARVRTTVANVSSHVTSKTAITTAATARLTGSCQPGRDRGSRCATRCSPYRSDLAVAMAEKTNVNRPATSNSALRWRATVSDTMAPTSTSAGTDSSGTTISLMPGIRLVTYDSTNSSTTMTDTARKRPRLTTRRTKASTSPWW